jgi:hypothetical protein
MVVKSIFFISYAKERDRPDSQPTRTDHPPVFSYIIRPMPDLQDQFTAAIASEAVEVLEDHLLFPGGYLLPLFARGSGVSGLADRPWSRLTSDVFYPNLPVMYSLAMRPEPPDVLHGSLRARGTLFEGFMTALAEKTGRRPSMVERSAGHAMDTAESELSFGKPPFQIALMSALFVERNRFHEAEAARRVYVVQSHHGVFRRRETIRIVDFLLEEG